MHARGKGLTGSVGRWSARHPWLAITLWVTFVVGSVVAGNQFSLVKLSASQSQAGESGKAAALLERHGLDIRPTETVLVRSNALTADAPAFKATVDDVPRQLHGTRNVQNIQSPYARTATSRATATRRSCASSSPGQIETAGDRVADAVRTTTAAQAAHPGFTIAEAGDGTFTKAVSDSTGKSTQRAESLTVPATLIILIVAFGGLLIAGVPVLLAFRPSSATRPGPHQPRRPDERHRGRDRAPDRHGRRRRLLALLRHPPREERSAAAPARGRRRRRRDLRPGRARLRAHRDRRDGGHVPGRHRPCSGASAPRPSWSSPRPSPAP